MENIINDLKILLDKVNKQFQTANNGIVATTSFGHALSEQTAEELIKCKIRF